MSKPSQTTHLVAVAAGEILAPVVEPTETERKIETLRASWQKSISEGEAILTDIGHMKWLVPQWLPLNALVVIYSEPGVGKSFYALSCALEIARGGEWCGTQLDEPLKVLYVAGERREAIRDRLEAWQTYHDEKTPRHFQLFYAPDTPQLNMATEQEALRQEIKARGVKVVVLDTYAMMTLGLNENDSKETGEIQKALARLVEATDGGLVIVNHHTNKGGGWGLDKLRGSGAFAGALDVAIQLGASDGRIEAKQQKNNHDSRQEASYRLTPVALAVTPEDTFTRSSAVLIEAKASAPIKQSDKVLLAILEDYDVAEGFTRANAEKVLDVKDGRANQILKALKDNGLVTNLSPETERLNVSKYFLTEKGRDRAEEVQRLDVARKIREAEER